MGAHHPVIEIGGGPAAPATKGRPLGIARTIETVHA